MSNNPLNLAIRFLLELYALFAFGKWAWVTHEGWLKYLLVILIPLLAAAAWGIFRVPGDPGNAPVAIPGRMRLVLESLFFGLAAFLLYRSGAERAALIFTAILLVHYVISYDRIAWLLTKK
ncbi:YrdB family protein [Flavihumibacter stibioxidans]|uniref:DUF2568 domain-containing protein n=1 Tax=Flavihumibacter stibioxidans TaxID=1834163 RepID=A0ABR7M9N3_9BACT|nr:YrdB family protein [Flavihumibacter stibioxidans]MBC6491677.1 hypothetical protein [Flavihumibacter stibioxidans]